MGGIFSPQDAIKSLTEDGSFIKNQESMLLTLEAQKNAVVEDAEPKKEVAKLTNLWQHEKQERRKLQMELGQK